MGLRFVRLTEPSSKTPINADKAVIDVERKINGYSLNLQHHEGAHKARVFKSALGYDADNSDNLVKQIREGVQRTVASFGKITDFGTQFGVDIPVPTGSAIVRTGWNYDPGSNVPRLTTAMVKKMMTTFQENQVVELIEDVVEDGITVARGARGTIVDVYTKPREGYEVEFTSASGDLIAQLTLAPSQNAVPHG